MANIRAFSFSPRSISTKLYFYLVLSLCAIAALSLTAVHFARKTESAAESLYGRGFVGVYSSAQLDILLERHARIVESMPSQMEKAEIERKEADLEAIGSRLGTLLEGPGLSDDPGVGAEKRISEYLPDLFRSAENVRFFAVEFAQDKALEHVREYNSIGAKIKELSQRYRAEKLDEARRSIRAVNDAAAAMLVWVFVFAAAAILLVGPLGLATMQRVLFRLKRITAAMTQLASSDTSVQVPYEDGADEVGAMARAVQVFKNNALELSSRENELTELNRRLDVAMNNMTHGLCMFDANRNLIICNRAYAELYALPEQLTRPGTPWDQIESHRTICGSGSSEQENLTAFKGTSFNDKLADGREIFVSRRPMSGGGWVAVHEDVTQRRKAEAEIVHLARHDIVTGLPNRFSMRERLRSALNDIRGPMSCAILCIDLDLFKAVNDTLGHPAGDRLLKQVGERLASATRTTDLVSRIGGDEFAVIQAEVDEAQQSADLAKRLIQVLSRPFALDGCEISIGASIGIAVAPMDGSDPDLLLKHADVALYAAKNQGRGHYCFYDSEMGQELRLQVELEQELRHAIATDGLDLYFQPIVSLKSGAVTSFEALVRWRSPSKGWIPPSELIPLAERTGIIHPLGAWILRQATAHAARWPKDIGVAVNVSAHQFRGTELVEITSQALAETGLPPSRLELEITETALLRDEAHVFKVLQHLREAGVRISLDDFGTGFSSLSYLRAFRFDKIKIDRSFVAEMSVRDDCKAIVLAITSLARKLGIRTTAEGIETAEQLRAVISARCDEGQGYLFAKPMPAHEVAAYLSNPDAGPQVSAGISSMGNYRTRSVAAG